MDITVFSGELGPQNSNLLKITLPSTDGIWSPVTHKIGYNVIYSGVKRSALLMAILRSMRLPRNFMVYDADKIGVGNYSVSYAEIEETSPLIV